MALDEAGRPSFSALQNYGLGNILVVYYVFDVMVLDGVDLTREPLARRRELLEQEIIPGLVLRSAGELPAGSCRTRLFVGRHAGIRSWWHWQ